MKPLCWSRSCPRRCRHTRHERLGLTDLIDTHLFLVYRGLGYCIEDKRIAGIEPQDIVILDIDEWRMAVDYRYPEIVVETELQGSGFEGLFQLGAFSKA